MKIICPQCSTAYEIPIDKIGDTGRKVKCASCNNIWQVDPKDDSSTIDEQDARSEVHSNSTTGNEDGSDHSLEGFNSDDLVGSGGRVPHHEPFSDEDFGINSSKSSSNSDSSKDDAEDGAKADSETEASSDTDETSSTDANEKGKKDSSDRASQKSYGRSRKKSKSSRKSGVISTKGLLGASLLAASVALCVAAVQYRDIAVRTFPDLAGLYHLAGMTVNLRGLVFKDLRTFREVDSGSVVLVVEGAVENITRGETHIPAIRLALRSQDTQEIHTWVVEPREDRLAPGDRTRFRARLNNPPERAADIQLRFIERQEKRASIR